jgi:hypothetical protein
MRLAGVTVGKIARPRAGARAPAAPQGAPQSEIDETIAALRTAVEEELGLAEPAPVAASKASNGSHGRRDSVVGTFSGQLPSIGLSVLLCVLAVLIGLAAIYVTAAL